MLQLFVVIIIVLAILAWRNIRQQEPKHRLKFILRYTLYALAIIAIALVATGRLHWIAAIITAALPVLQRALPLLLKFIPFIQQRSSKQSSKETPPPTNNIVMDEAEALKILGLNSNATEEEIVLRHRQLIQKNHPDRGGSDYLAAQINKAKEILLARIKK